MLQLLLALACFVLHYDCFDDLLAFTGSSPRLGSIACLFLLAESLLLSSV